MQLIIIRLIWIVDGSSFIIVESTILLVVVIESVGILKVLVLFSGLGFASIAFFPEREVEIVAIETYPVTLPSLVVCLNSFIGSLRFFDRSGVGVVHLCF